MSAWNSFEASARGYEATFHSEQASTSSTGAQKRTIDVEDDAEVVAVAPPQTNKLSTTMPATKKLATAGNWLAAAKPKLPTQAPSLWSTHALKGSGAKDSLIVRRDPSMIPRTKIAAFDFDGTLTENAGHATSKVSQYRMWCDTVVPTLQRYHADGYALLIVSNQNAIKSAVTGAKATTVKGAIDMVASKLGVPIDACLATQKDTLRKPSGGMWEWYLAHGAGAARSSDGQPGSSLVDLAQSFFVGDAAGRPGDHSDVDSGFAKTVGLRFMTPEQCFGDATNSSGASSRSSGGSSNRSASMPSSNEGHGGVGSSGPQALPFPREAVRAAVVAAGGASGTPSSTSSSSSSSSGSSRRPILLMLCGLVGSGKSTWAANLMVRGNAAKASTSSSSSSSVDGGATAAETATTTTAAAATATCSSAGITWVIVSQDVLKSRDKCEKVCAGALAAGQSVIIDRTNLTAEQRASFVQLVLKAVPKQADGRPGAAAHALSFALPLGVCKERVKARTEHPTKVMGAGGLRILSMLLSKGVEPPTKQEGFEVVAEARNEKDLAGALEAYAHAP